MIGELRNGAEAYGFLRILAAGHKGGLTTWHAEEGEAFEALELMVKQHPAGAQIPDAKVRAYLRRYLDIIIWCDKGDDGYGAPRVWFRAAEDAEGTGAAETVAA
jgi:type IV secretion system protein VirB11